MSIGKALTVDDSPAIRAVIKVLLEAIGFDVVEADSVHSALGQLELNRFDVIVTDMNMPGESGLGLIRRLQREPQRHRVPVLVVSSETNPALKALSLKDGAAGWVQKPIDPASLIQAVTDCSLGRRRSYGLAAAHARRRAQRPRACPMAVGA